MPIYPWSKDHLQRKILNFSKRLPDYNLDPPEDEDKKKSEGSDEPDNWENTCQQLGLHS